MLSLSLVAVSVLASAPLTVQEVRAEARQQLDAIRAELDVARAEQGRRLAVSAILPQVNASLSASPTYLGPTRSYYPVPQADGTYVQQAVETPAYASGNFSFSVTVRQLLYDGGRWWNQIAQAGAQEQAARGQLEEQRLSSELEAVRRFYDLLKAQVSLQVLTATAERSRQQVDRARALYEAGRGPRSGVFDAITNLGNDEINVVRQRQRIVESRLALLQWLGRSDADVEAVAPEGLDAPQPVPPLDRALEAARTARPLIRVLFENTRAADLGVSLGWGNHLPQLGLNLGYFRSSPTPDPFFTDLTQQNVLQAGLTLNLNLFNGFAYDAQIRQAQVELTRAQEVQKQSLVDLEAELRRTHDSARIEREVLELNEKQLQVAQEQLGLEEQRFSAGAGSTLEVRNAQVKFTQAQLAVLSGRADVAVARAALERTVGGAVP
jgi:outer membrane protein